MRIAQPAVSQHIKAVEQEFGAQLFERKRKGVTPTEAGHAVLRQVQQMLEIYDRARADLQDARGAPHGAVTLGLPTTVAAVLSAPLIKRVVGKYPGIRLRIVESMSGHLREWVDQGRVDLAVLFEPTDGVESAGEPLLVEALFLVMSATSYQFRPAETIAAAQLAGLPLCLPGNPHSLRAMVDRFAAQNELDLDIRFELDATFAMRDLVADGYACTILPLSPIRRDVSEGRLRALRITAPDLERRLVFCRSPVHTFSPAFAVVRDELIAALDEMHADRSWGARMITRRRAQHK
jgi:LysR family nitrogen assimilation transcriptional regulator